MSQSMTYSLPAKFSKNPLNAYGDGGVLKAAFHRAGMKLLKAVAEILAAKGYVTDSLSSNKAGIAVSGEVTGIWFHPAKAAGIYIQLSESCVRMPGGAPNGLCIMYRANNRRQKYTGFQNCWVAWNSTAEELAAKVLVEAERNEGRASQ